MTQDLEPKAVGAVPATINKPGRGHEEQSDTDEVEIPRAKLVQFTSGEAQSENPDDARKPGSMINSVTKEEIGRHFIPIFRFVNFIQWNPRKKDDPNFDAAYEPGAMIFSTADRNDPRVTEGTKFGPDGSVPKVTKYLNFLCVFENHPMPLILSFAKTSFPAGKKLNTLTQFSGGDMFGAKYRLIVSKKEGDAGAYFALDVAPVGKVNEEEFKTAEYWYNEFRGKTVKVHQEEKWSE